MFDSAGNQTGKAQWQEEKLILVVYWHFINFLTKHCYSNPSEDSAFEKLMYN